MSGARNIGWRPRAAIEQGLLIACAGPPLPARTITVERVQASFPLPARPQAMWVVASCGASGKGAPAAGIRLNAA
jgi:hypothetical protein